MKKYLVFLLFCHLFFAIVQGSDVRSIDDFEIATPSIVIVIPTNPTFPLCSDTYTYVGSSKEIIGGERDLSLTVYSGSENRVLVAGVTLGEFSCTSPVDTQSSSLLQYDGVDNSINLNPSGLGGIDFTLYGGNAIRLVAFSDAPTTISLVVYSGSVGEACYVNVTLPGYDYSREYILDFNSFTSGCDFQNVGAIEVITHTVSSVDIIIQSLYVYANPTTVTALPSPTSHRQFDTLFYIDDFSVSTPEIIIFAPYSGIPVVDSSHSIGSSSQIIGTERDLSLTAYSGGLYGSVLEEGVSSGVFTCNTPFGSTGSSLLQYDGVDGSINLNATGLGGIDFTQKGGFALKLTAMNDVNTLDVNIRIYSSQNEICSRNVTLNESSSYQDYILDYNNFNGTCDFTDVGAVELNIDLPQGEDIFVDEISAITLYQLPTSSATPTASQPSPTRTPTPANW